MPSLAILLEESEMNSNRGPLTLKKQPSADTFGGDVNQIRDLAPPVLILDDFTPPKEKQEHS